MLIRLLTIYLDLNLFNKDCLFKTKIKKNCNTKVSALFFPIIVVASSVNYSPLSSLCWLLGRFWRNFFERSLLFIGYFIVFIQRHPNLSDLICIFLKSHNIFILPYACDSNLSKKKSIIVTTEIFSQFKIDGLKILRQLMINQTIQLMLVVLSKQKSTRNKMISRSAVFRTGNAACSFLVKTRSYLTCRTYCIILLKY